MGKDPKTELPTLRLKNGNAVHLAAPQHRDCHQLRSSRGRGHRPRRGECLPGGQVPVATKVRQAHRSCSPEVVRAISDTGEFAHCGNPRIGELHELFAE